MSLFILFVTTLMDLSSGALAVVISDAPGSHDVIPAEPRYGLNLDGVAQLGWEGAASDSIHDVIAVCSGSLITDRHVLTAAHCFDEDADGRVDALIGGFPFLAAFELADGPVFLPVDTNAIHFPPGWPRKNADLAVIELASTAPADIPRYSLYGGADEVGRKVVITGYCDTGHGSSGSDATLDAGRNIKRAGLNQYDAVRDDLGTPYLAYDFDNGEAEQNALDVIGFESDLGLGLGESMSAEGDSGGPTFIDGMIAGVSAFGTRVLAADVTDATDASWGDLHFDTRVSAFEGFITSVTGGAASFANGVQLPGDYNASGLVEQADLDLVLLHWGADAAAVPDSWTNDLPTGTVDQDELDRVLLNWGNASASLGAASVPEPSGLVLIATCLIAWVAQNQPLRWRPYGCPTTAGATARHRWAVAPRAGSTQIRSRQGLAIILEKTWTTV